MAALRDEYAVEYTLECINIQPAAPSPYAGSANRPAHIF